MALGSNVGFLLTGRNIMCVRDSELALSAAPLFPLMDEVAGHGRYWGGGVPGLSCWSLFGMIMTFIYSEACILPFFV